MARTDAAEFGGRISLDIKTESMKRNSDIMAESSNTFEVEGDHGHEHKSKEPTHSQTASREYSKTPMDDGLADFPLVDDEENKEDVSDNVDLNNTLFSGSKLMVSSFVKQGQKSLRHEVFTYDHIDDLNPDKMDKRKQSKESEMDEIMCDEKLSSYAKRKLKKYRKLGELIERSKTSDLCIVTMPFPRAEYTSYEYMKILHSLTPKAMDNLIFVRGNQDQVLTFAL